MNQFFSLPRFGRLLRKHTTENLARYALGAAVLLGGMLVVMGFLSYLSGGISHVGQAVLFILFLMGAGSFFTSTMLGQFGVGSRAALALTLPASQFEKYLVAWLFSLPVFLAVFVADFYLADWLVLSFSRGDNTLLNVFGDAEAVITVGIVFLVLHGVALYGSIFFRQYQFIKTAFVFFLAATVLIFINYQVMKGVIGPEFRMAMPLGSVNLKNGPSLSLPDEQSRPILLPLLALLPLLWLAAYARLTEKQL
ncbi:MAG TPA: hypothetical protein VFO93_14035 [Hymenobacter sp.]|uniref:hypothetical protein n=1 Tax=Hymenobacter sp. TaxID=1898978 RepID=UPI002D7F94A1|nr:hypothetical protein [Hymenobacter sp.]HET9504657.1 hypothetical protein [Hymenobacter sp.]